MSCNVNECKYIRFVCVLIEFHGICSCFMNVYKYAFTMCAPVLLALIKTVCRKNTSTCLLSVITFRPFFCKIRWVFGYCLVGLLVFGKILSSCAEIFCHKVALRCKWLCDWHRTKMDKCEEFESLDTCSKNKYKIMYIFNNCEVKCSIQIIVDDINNTRHSIIEMSV